MNILSTQYSILTHSFEIYVAGCNGQPHCKGCHNPESWDYTNGELYNKDYLSKIAHKIQSFYNLVDNIMIFGGEPLDRNIYEINGLLTMLTDLQNFNKPIWLFTRHSLVKIPNEIRVLCDYIKCGEYIPELKCDNNIQYGIKLATSNQIIYKKGCDY